MSGRGNTIAAQTPAKRFNKTRRITITALLSATCISTNYLMLPLINIKLMDTIVFIAGFSLGLIPAITVGSISWLIYGTLNPLGVNLPTLITVILSETVYAIPGWIIGRKYHETTPQPSLELHLTLGATGLLTTLTYDLFTNAIYGWLFQGSIWIGLLTMNFPIPMGITHEVSNFILFATVAPFLIRAIKKII